MDLLLNSTLLLIIIVKHCLDIIITLFIAASWNLNIIRISTDLKDDIDIHVDQEFHAEEEQDNDHYDSNAMSRFQKLGITTHFNVSRCLNQEIIAINATRTGGEDVSLFERGDCVCYWVIDRRPLNSDYYHRKSDGSGVITWEITGESHKTLPAYICPFHGYLSASTWIFSLVLVHSRMDRIFSFYGCGVHRRERTRIINFITKIRGNHWLLWNSTYVGRSSTLYFSLSTRELIYIFR